MNDIVGSAAAHWSAYQTQIKPRRAWWHSPRCVRHVNKMICGKALDGLTSGDKARLTSAFPGRVFQRAVSIGCGLASKEMNLIQAGVVARFDLYEVAEPRVSAARADAERRGITDRVKIHHAPNDFGMAEPIYDLVYWNNSLHHMPDTAKALDWSVRALEPNGVLYMNDYTGPNQVQWSGSSLAAIWRARAALPQRYLRRPDGGQYPVQIRPHSVDAWIKMDPSEAADSEAILPALHRLLPQAEVKALGGLLYTAAVHDCLDNFDDDADAAVLDALLFADEVLASAGLSYFTSALAVKA